MSSDAPPPIPPAPVPSPLAGPPPRPLAAGAPPAAPRRRSSGWLRLFLLLSLLANLGLFLYLRATRGEGGLGGTPFYERHLSGERDARHRLAVVRVEGLIATELDGHVGHDGMVGDVREQLRLALEDDSVKAILLRIDSPGGEVLASDEIYRAVRDARKKKPVVCSMGSVAASGGYYAAMGSSWIVADNLTITGSIGVVMETLNYKGLFEKIGLKSVTLKSGKFKDILNGGRDATPEELELVQSLIMESYDQFLKIVASERKLDAEALRGGVADGRILSGKQALAVKLVDQVGSFQDAVKKAEELAKVQDAEVFDYVVPFSLRNLLSFLAETRAPKLDLGLAAPTLQLKPGKLYYLSLHLY
jgi:protease-4